MARATVCHTGPPPLGGRVAWVRYTKYGPGTNRKLASGHVAFFSVWRPYTDSCICIPFFPNLDSIHPVQRSHSDHPAVIVAP
jgi:hypothetical protein